MNRTEGTGRVVGRRTPAVILAAVLVAGVVPVTGVAGVHGQEVLAVEVPFAPAPVVVGGAQRLVYEVHLTNFSSQAVHLQRLEVVGAGVDAPLAELGAAELAPRTAPLGSSSPDLAPLEIGSGEVALVYLEIELDPGVPGPAELAHRIEYSRAGADEPERVVTGRTHVQGPAPLVLGAPLSGGPWAAIHHPSWARGHRRVHYIDEGRPRIPGRFAIDFFLLDDAGGVARGDRDAVANWHGYGADVLAVADGIVIAARDDVAESAHISAHTRLPLRDGTGNYVALELGDGRFVFYEHLKPGSLRVVPGQRVQRGEAIAAVGFTGHTSGPHLHFHLADGAAPLGAEGVPFALARFLVVGHLGDDVRSLFQAPWTPQDPAERVGEMPAPNSVLFFAEPSDAGPP